jgi:hypothetical protein
MIVIVIEKTFTTKFCRSEKTFFFVLLRQDPGSTHAHHMIFDENRQPIQRFTKFAS